MGVTMTLLAMFGMVPPAANRALDADVTMQAFVSALRARDCRKLATFLCATGKVRYLNTLERPYQRSRLDCRRVEQLHELLLGDDGLRDYVMMSGRRPWRRKGALTYVPPYATGDPIHVRWRREGERLVIVELALPSA